MGLWRFDLRFSKRKKDELDLIRLAEAWPELRGMYPRELQEEIDPGLRRDYDDAMPNIATSVRISEDALQLLSSLSVKLRQPKAQVVELALRELALRKRAGIPWSSRQKAEIEFWERAAAKDFHGESW